MKSRAAQHVPDILDCLAQLSNDEVPTPPTLARDMLDLLPAEVWTRSDYRWLDPFCKSGVFLREIAARLLVGLESWEPDFDKRRDHIFRYMLFGTSITEMTGIIARRSLYCSRDASGDRSVVRFATETGNLPFIPTEHTFRNGRCAACGATEELERGERRENYAYSFIHHTYPTSEMAGMKFDVIIGNPPFQLGDGGGGGGASATPIYNLFVEQALALQPRHLVMITPSRWFSGGKNLDDFRDKMLAERHFAQLVDFPRLYDCFPGVKIRGGVSYWHWDREYSGPCRVTTMIGNEAVGESTYRYLDAYDVLVRRNEAIAILDKVAAYTVDGLPERSLAEVVSARKPFGLSNERGSTSSAGIDKPIKVFGNQNISYMDRSIIKQNQEWIDEWKVLLVKAHGTSGREDTTILGQPIVAGPGTACTETYLVIGRFDDELSAKRLAIIMRSRLVRFLVSLRKITQNITRDSYRFVPQLPLDRDWSDELLYERYDLTAIEIAFIESQVVPMDAVGDTA